MNQEKYIELSKQAANIITTKFFYDLPEQQKDKFRSELLAFGNGDVLTDFVISIIQGGTDELNKENNQ